METPIATVADSIETRILNNLDRLRSYGEKLGIRVKAYRSREEIAALELSVQQQVLKNIEFSLQVFDSVEIDNPSTDLEVRLFKRALDFLNLEPLDGDDVYSHIDHEDIIEIYNPQFTQLYRNLTFMKYCSYDLVTLITVPFFDLYDRNSSIDSEIVRDFERKKPKNQ